MCDCDKTFVKSEKGLYHAFGPITSDDIIRTAAAILQGLPVPTCTYSRGYWSGGCKCH